MKRFSLVLCVIGLLVFAACTNTPTSSSSSSTTTSAAVSSSAGSSSSVSTGYSVVAGLVNFTNMATGARIDIWSGTTVTTNNSGGTNIISMNVPSGGGCKIFPGMTNWSDFLTDGVLILKMRSAAGNNTVNLQPEAPSGGYLGWKSLSAYGMTNDNDWHIVTVPVSFLFSGNEGTISNVQGMIFDGTKPLVFDIEYEYLAR